MWSEDDIQRAIDRSGYPLEHRVEAMLQRLGYETRANAVMRDPATGKGRETDLTARRCEACVPDKIWERPRVGVVLLVECVRTDTPIVFYEKVPSFEECGWLQTLFGYPLYMADPPGSHGFARVEDLAGVSWNDGEPAATNWHTFEGKPGGELKASRRHDVHGTLEKLMHRAEAIMAEYVRPGPIDSEFGGGTLHFIRPVLVVGGSLRARAIGPDPQGAQSRERVRHLRATLIENRPVVWGVDVVTEAGLASYHNTLLERIDRVARFCIDHREQVQAALKSDLVKGMCKRGPIAPRI